MFKLNKVIVLLAVFASMNTLGHEDDLGCVDVGYCEKILPNAFKIMKELVKVRAFLEKNELNEENKEKLFCAFLNRLTLRDELEFALVEDLSKVKVEAEGKQALILQIMEKCQKLALEAYNK